MGWTKSLRYWLKLDNLIFVKKNSKVQFVSINKSGKQFQYQVSFDDDDATFLPSTSLKRKVREINEVLKYTNITS